MPELSYEYVDAPAAAESRNGTHRPAAVSHPRKSEVIRFQANTPERVCLLYAKPKSYTKPWEGGGIGYRFTNQDGRVFFLDADPTLKIEHLQLKAGELFWVCNRKSGQRGDPGSWDVYLDPATERARGLVAAPEPKAPQLAQHRTPSARDASTSTSPSRSKDTMVTTFGQRLAGTTNALIDVYANALAYSERHGDKVRKDDVLALLLAALNKGDQ
jgi:hypothetical protein